MFGKRVTLKDLSKETGLSLSTISKILGNRSKFFQEKTRQTVFKAAEKYGYSPNAGARMIRYGRFNCISLILSTVPERSSLLPGFLSGIQAALNERKIRLELSEIPDEKLSDPDFIPGFISESMSDGILMNYFSNIPASIEKNPSFRSIPCVWSNVKRSFDCVYPNDFLAGKTATEKLLERGHRRITYLDLIEKFDPVEHHYSVLDRYEGYAAAMREAGLEPIRFIKRGDVSEDGLVGLLKNHLSSSTRPTAVISYYFSLLLLKAAYEASIKIPSDLSLVTFHENDIYDSMQSMAIMKIPTYEMGYSGVEMLIEKIADPRKKLKPRVLPFSFHENGGICPP